VNKIIDAESLQRERIARFKASREVTKQQNSSPDKMSNAEFFAGCSGEQANTQRDYEMDDVIETPEISKPKIRPFEFISSDKLSSAPIDYKWLVKDFIEQANIIEVFGPSKNGKSFVALDMAFCIAAGIDWNGREVKQGAVIYIAGEGFNGIARRIKALEIKYQCKAPGLHISKVAAQLLDEENTQLVKTAIAEICDNPAMVIIDTLNRNFGDGDENSTRDMTRFIANIDNHFKQKNTSVMIIHHSGLSDSGRSRGSSSLYCALDLQYKVTKTNNFIVFENTKVKDIPEPPAVNFEMKQIEVGTSKEGDPITSVYLKLVGQVDNTAPTKRLSVAEESALKSLRRVAESQGIEPTSKMKRNFSGLDDRKVVHLDDWRKEFYSWADIDGSLDAKKKKFQRVRDGLQKARKITTMDGYFWEIFPSVSAAKK